MQKKVAELITERNTLRDEFAAQKREFQQYLAEKKAGETWGNVEKPAFLIFNNIWAILIVNRAP